MKNLDELESQELQALKVGEEVAIRAIRGPEYRAYILDSFALLRAASSQLIISVAQSEVRDVVQIGQVAGMPATGPQIAVKRVNAKSVNVEVAQLRLTTETAIELGLALLTNTLPHGTEFLRARLSENRDLKAALAGND